MLKSNRKKEKDNKYMCSKKKLFFILIVYDVLFDLIVEEIKLLEISVLGFSSILNIAVLNNLKFKIKKLLKIIEVNYSSIILAFIYINELINSIPLLFMKVSFQK